MAPKESLGTWVSPSLGMAEGRSPKESDTDTGFQRGTEMLEKRVTEMLKGRQLQHHAGEHRLGSVVFRLCVFFAANPTRVLDTLEALDVVGDDRPYLRSTGNLTHALRKAVVDGWLDRQQPVRGRGQRALYCAGPTLRALVGAAE